jgi:hypothetical protein
MRGKGAVGVAVAFLVVASPAGLAGQASGACSLLSQEEIRGLLGARTPRFFDMVPANQENLPAGGSECFYAGINTQLDAIPVARFQSTMEVFASRTTYERVGEVGDEAYFYEQDAGRSTHVVGVYARVGQRVLVVSMDVTEGVDRATLRPDVLALARAAAAKLR